jgi:hypothetical protein
MLRPRESIVAEMDAAEDREVAQAIGLAADLGEQRRRLAARRGNEHLHAGPQVRHGAGERLADERAGHGRPV